jgi:O-Antigen ligase
VLLASRPKALTHAASSLAAASHAGHHVAAELAGLALVQAGVGAAWVVLADRIAVGRSARRAFLAAVAAAVAVAVVGVVVHYGSPTTIARHAYDSFTAPPTSGTNLNSRLFSFSNDGRTVLWRAAVNEFDAHPIFGDGAGSFQRWWYAHRTSGYDVQDAHDLYVQTLGELGVVGGVLLGLFLLAPLAAAVRARRHPLVAPAVGAYVAFLAHCIVDWDWQVPAVTLVALFAGAAIVVAARGDDARSVPPLGRRTRRVVGSLAGAAAVVAFVGLIGNLALAKVEDAIPNGHQKEALAQAKKAHRWAPWSAEALRDLGEARILNGQKAAGLADLRSAAAKDPGDWQTWFDIASTTSGTEQTDAIRRVEALNPQSPEAGLLDSVKKKGAKF